MRTIEHLTKSRDERPVIIIRPLAETRTPQLRLIRNGSVVDVQLLAQQRDQRGSLRAIGRALARTLLGSPSTSA
jgi:hypothetical protein